MMGVPLRISLHTRTLPALALAAAMSLPAASASAVVLVAGSNPLPGTTLAAEPHLAGLVVEDELTDVAFVMGDGIFSATIQSRVVLAGDGTYDFYWWIRDTQYTGTAPVELGAFRIGNFGMPVVGLNANYRTDGVGQIGPVSAFAFSGAFAEFVNFSFSGLRAGNESRFMFLDTEATRYARTAFFDLSNVDQTEASDTFSTFGVAVVPEPATLALMIAGFGGAGAMLRRRRVSPAAG